MTTYAKGDRVRLVHGEIGGLVISEVFLSPTFGTPRLRVLWDGEFGTVSAWNPVFLRPADAPASEDPARVEDAHTIMEFDYTTSKVTGIRHKRKHREKDE